jgi:hypothetical protein
MTKQLNQGFKKVLDERYRNAIKIKDYSKVKALNKIAKDLNINFAKVSKDFTKFDYGVKPFEELNIRKAVADALLQQRNLSTELPKYTRANPELFLKAGIDLEKTSMEIPKFNIGNKEFNTLIKAIKNSAGNTLITIGKTLKCPVAGLGKAEGGRIGLAAGTSLINCISTKVNNDPIGSSQKISLIEESSGAMNKVKNVARGFLGVLGKWGPKVGKYGAIMAAGAVAQPLVKQFMNDDPSTYLTDENQQAGMLEALIEGERPKPRSEILDWGTTAGEVGATAAAVPGSGALYKYRRGLSETKIPKAGPVSEAGLTAGDYLSKHAGKGYGKIRAGAGVGMKLLSGMFTPAGLMATEPLRIAQKRREGESWGDIATSPETWMGPAFAPSMTRIATAGMKKGSLLPRLLRLGISRGALAAMGPVGWAGLAASLGWEGYSQYQDYKKGRGFFASDEE